MKITCKTRVSAGRLDAIIFFSILFGIIFCSCGTTEIKRMDTEPTASTSINRSYEETTTTAIITATTTVNSTFTTTSTTTTSKTTETSTTLVTTITTVITESIIQEIATESNKDTVIEVLEETSSEEFIGTFSRGTFYTTGSYGGSGRNLVSGYSIASRAIYEAYGYGDYKIRIECEEFPELNGIYSLDDCSAPGNYEVIDFWFAPSDVPSYFREMGVFEVKAYIVY